MLSLNDFKPLAFLFLPSLQWITFLSSIQIQFLHTFTGFHDLFST